MKHNADKHRKEVEFSVGDMILAKLQPYRQLTAAFRLHNKLYQSFFGLFKIKEKISSVAYKLELPIGSRIHDCFHISKLKAFIGPKPLIVDSHPLITIRNEPILFPVEILDCREIYRKRKKIPQLLVQWKGSLLDDSNWEDDTELLCLFPSIPP